MLAVLFLCGPIGTAVSFYLLPKESDSADTPGLIRGGATGATGAAGGTRVRMVHLSLAGTDRRARFVLDENTPWDAFVSGCRERLKVERILRVTDSSGEAILAVEDLVHEDHIVIHATMGGGQAAPVPGPADEHRPGTAPSPPALSSAGAAHGAAGGAMGGKSRALQSVVAGHDSLASTGSLNLSLVGSRSHELASRLQELRGSTGERGESIPELLHQLGELQPRRDAKARKPAAVQVDADADGGGGGGGGGGGEPQPDAEAEVGGHGDETVVGEAEH